MIITVVRKCNTLDCRKFVARRNTSRNRSCPPLFHPDAYTVAQHVLDFLREVIIKEDTRTFA